MKTFWGIVVALLFVGPAMGADYGIGISLHHTSSKIYFPIRMSPTFLIEPTFNYLRQDIDQSTSSTTSVSNDLRTWDLGVGLFSVRRTAEDVGTHVGVRLGYRKSDGRALYPASYSAWWIAPTVGVEYFVRKNITVGAEAGYAYSTSDSRSSSPGSTSYTDQTNAGTTTDITLRYYF